MICNRRLSTCVRVGVYVFVCSLLATVCLFICWFHCLCVCLFAISVNVYLFIYLLCMSLHSIYPFACAYY